MRKLIGVILCGALWVWAHTAAAQNVSQTIGHGKVDWTNKKVIATGSGAPSLKASSVTVARLGAERAAKLDALRNILETVKGVRISGETAAGSKMKAAPELKAKVEGIVRGFKVLDTKYYSDGGVDVIVEVPLDGVLTTTLLEGTSTAAKKSPAMIAADPSGTTGVIINATGLGAIPALAPRVVDEGGKEVFGANKVAMDAVQKHGVVGYSASLDAAMKDGRVSDKPLIIRAMKVTAPGASDLVVSAEDGAKIGKLAGLLGGGKVIIVTD